MDRNRTAEFSASGSVEQLKARYQGWLEESAAVFATIDDATLELGTVNETISVVPAAPLLQKDTEPSVSKGRRTGAGSLSSSRL